MVNRRALLVEGPKKNVKKSQKNYEHAEELYNCSMNYRKSSVTTVVDL